MLNPDLFFILSTNAIIVFWLLLIVAPYWVWTRRIVHAPWVTLVLAIAYMAFALPGFITGDMPEEGGFGTLEEVMVLFGSKPAVMAGWLHYLAFDLFIGAWEVRDSRRLGIPHLAVVPCLIFTLLLGPVGLGLYLTLRLALRRQATLVETGT